MERRSVETTIGVHPSTMELEPVWKRVENLIDRCLNSDIGKKMEGRLRRVLDRAGYKKITTWTIERHDGRFWSTATGYAHVYLHYTSGRRFDLRVWEQG